MEGNDFWRSEEGRKLLWKAFPAGYLAVRGVLTVGGWLCRTGRTQGDERRGSADVSFEGDGGLTWKRESWCLPEDPKKIGCLFGNIDGNFESLRLSGDLLPLPNPSDAATWACLLKDLAIASGAVPKDVLVGGYTWQYCADGSWWLSADHVEESPDGAKFASFARFASDGACGKWRVDVATPQIGKERDPARALVLARIQARERLGR